MCLVCFLVSVQFFTDYINATDFLFLRCRLRPYPKDCGPDDSITTCMTMVAQVPQYSSSIGGLYSHSKQSVDRSCCFLRTPVSSLPTVPSLVSLRHHDNCAETEPWYEWSRAMRGYVLDMEHADVAQAFVLPHVPQRHQTLFAFLFPSHSRASMRRLSLCTGARWPSGRRFTVLTTRPSLQASTTGQGC